MLRSIIFWVLAATILGIFVGIGMTPGLMRATVSAGALSASHSNIADCAGCHGVEPTGLADMVTKAVHGAPHKELSESCAKCHAAQASGEAHNLTKAELDVFGKGKKVATNDVPLDARIALMLGVPLHGAEGVESAGASCLSCHSEHSGRDGALTPAANASCNRCHVQKVAKTLNLHPPFANYPNSRRQRIRFDHDSHLKRHFDSQSVPQTAPKDCVDCHILSASGSAMLTGGFKRTCEACHGSDLKQKSITLFGVPQLDLEALASRGGRVGQWPDGIDRVDLPAFMELLLATDPEYRVARAALVDAKVFPEDLPKDKVTDAQIGHVETVAWAVKRQLENLLKGEARTTSGTSAGTGENPAGEKGAKLVQGETAKQISLDSLRLLQKSLFPNLKAELAMLDKGKDQGGRSTTSSVSVTNDPRPKVVDGFIYDFGGIEYLFDSHDRPDVMRGLLDLAVHLEHSAPSAASKAFLTSVTDKDHPGRCVQCHSIDVTPQGAVVNWQSFRPDPKRRNMTMFRHAPHLTGPETACRSCHILGSGAGFAESFAQPDPLKFVGGFQAMTIGTCVQCHTAQLVSDGCVTCHDYHVTNGPGR